MAVSSKHTATRVTRRSARIRVLAEMAAQEGSSAAELISGGSGTSAPLGCDDPLVVLGPLERAQIVQRPSKAIKSPYVADVALESGGTALAHAPALDCGGLCSPQAWVRLQARPQGGKTSHSIDLVETPDALVGSHPQLGERIAEQLLVRGLLADAIGLGPAAVAGKAAADQGQAVLRKQVTHGDSRVDFEVTSGDGRRTLIEVKNVVSGHPPSKQGKHVGGELSSKTPISSPIPTFQSTPPNTGVR